MRSVSFLPDHLVDFVLFICALCLANTLRSYLQRFVLALYQRRLDLHCALRLEDWRDDKEGKDEEYRKRKRVADDLCKQCCCNRQRDDEIEKKFQCESVVLFILTAILLYTGYMEKLGKGVILAVWPIFFFFFRYYRFYRSDVAYITTRLEDEKYVNNYFSNIRDSQQNKEEDCCSTERELHASPKRNLSI